jgi:imidazolonepropionase-like amidohydrolase
MSTVLSGGTVVDADGTREADVLVVDDEVVDVDPAAGEGEVAADATVVDVAGSYVAPGLIDAHVHLVMDGRPDAESVATQSVERSTFVAAANARDAVRAGVTTVRDLGSQGGVALAARGAVADGLVTGPRVRACGHNVVMTGGHGSWFGREADGPAEVRKAAREQLTAGADVVKCMATGGVLTSGAKTGAPELTPEELGALVDAASAKGVPTAAHAHGAVGIKNAVRAGITSIEHGTFMDREAAALMAEADTYWVPTAAALHGIVDAGVEAGIPAEAVAKAEAAADRFDDAFTHAADAGVTIAMGTDAGTPFNDFADVPRELQLLVEHGVDPADTLAAATTNAAALLGLDDVGLVAEGYAADLVVLPDDPTADATAWQSPEAVFARGERVA